MFNQTHAFSILICWKNNSNPPFLEGREKSDKQVKITLPETNIAPENGWLED